MKKVLLFLWLTPGLAAAQQKVIAIGQVSVAPLYPLVHQDKANTYTQSSNSPAVLPVVFFNGRDLPVSPKATSPVGPRDYYQQCFGYFCKREWNWEKQTKVPVKLRLGSYQEAQRLEGK